MWLLQGDVRSDSSRIVCLWLVQLLSLLNEPIPLADHLKQPLDQSLGFVHLLVADQEFDRLIRVDELTLFWHQVLVSRLSFPLFLKTQPEHQRFESVETECIQFAKSFILYRILTSHLTLELVDVVLALDLAKDLHCRLLQDLLLVNLIATVLESLRLAGHREFAPTDCFLLLCKVNLVKDRAQSPVN